MELINRLIEYRDKFHHSAKASGLLTEAISALKAATPANSQSTPLCGCGGDNRGGYYCGDCGGLKQRD